MFVLLTYDVNVKRVVKVKKICEKYLNHVQKSVFEGVITEKKLKQLQREIKAIIKIQEDQCTIYILESLKYVSKEEIGMVDIYTNFL